MRFPLCSHFSNTNVLEKWRGILAPHGHLEFFNVPYGYIEVRGMGVCNKIIPLLWQHNGTETKCIATKHSAGQKTTIY